MGRPQKLDDRDISRRVSEMEGWTYEDGSLRRQLRFADFVAAFSFMTRVAIHAEKADHHPDWSNVYNRVAIALNTHDAGGVTELDFDLAAKIDQEAARS